MSMDVVWRSAEAAPKDGSLFLADMGWPWPCLVCWNEYEGKWIYPNMQINRVDGKYDPYFDTEYCKLKELKRWSHLPIVGGGPMKSDRVVEIHGH